MCGGNHSKTNLDVKKEAEYERDIYTNMYQYIRNN